MPSLLNQETEASLPDRRILQVTSYGPKHLGGLEACAEMLAKHLRREGWKVSWAYCAKGDDSRPADELKLSFIDPAEAKSGIPMPIPTLSGVLSLWTAVRASDYVLIHDVYYFTSLFATIAATLAGKPLILLVHVWKVPSRNPLISLAQAVTRTLFGFVCGQAASVIVTYNRMILSELRRRFRSEKCHFIANGVHDSFGQPAITGHASRSRKRIVFAGRFVEKKGLHLIRQAAQVLPEIDFLLCGSGPIDPSAWNLPNVSTRLASKRELAAIFQEADLLLLPSRGEGFPLVIQEAMRCGLPCAIFRETWAAWGRDPELFVLLNETYWLDSLREFLSKPQSTALTAGLRIYAQKEWSWKRTAEAYSQLFLQLNRQCRRPNSRSYPASIPVT